MHSIFKWDIYFLHNPSLFTHEFISPFTIVHNGFIYFTSLPSPIHSRAYTCEHYITYPMAALYPLYHLSNALSFPFGFIPKTYLALSLCYPFFMAISWLYNPFIQWLYINLALPFAFALCLILACLLPCLAYLSLFFSWLYCLSMYPIIHLYGISCQAIDFSFLSLSLLSLNV